MRKAIAAIITVIMCLTFISCDSSSEVTADNGTLCKTISIVQNNNRNRITAEDENYIYFYNVNEILKMSKTDDSVETIYTFEGDNYMGFNSIEYFDNALYMIGMGRDPVLQLATVKTDGTGMNKVTLEDINQIPNFYTFEDNLYLKYMFLGNDRAFEITPGTLDLNPVDIAALSQFNAADGSIFVKKIEDNRGKLYKTDAAGNTELFLHRDKSVFFHHITDYYVFYILIDPVEQLYWEVYRCDLDGNNNTLIKEIPLMSIGGTAYDNENLYISEVNGPLWKINKETLEISDVLTVNNIEFIDTFTHEVNNGKFFYSFTSIVYYIDTVTGEKVEG